MKLTDQQRDSFSAWKESCHYSNWLNGWVWVEEADGRHGHLARIPSLDVAHWGLETDWFIDDSDGYGDFSYFNDNDDTPKPK